MEVINISVSILYNCKEISQLKSVDVKKDYSVQNLLIQLDRNLVSKVSARFSGRPQGMKLAMRLVDL